MFKKAFFAFFIFGSMASHAATIAPNIKGFYDCSAFAKANSIDTDHKYYLSVSNVTYSQKAKALQMVSRFFMDDVEDVLNERLDQKITLGNPDGLKELQPILDRYFSKRLSFKANGKEITPKVLGAEYDVDQIVIYIELPMPEAPKSVEVSNKALFELFPDQKNLIHFKINNQRKSLLNSSDTPLERLNF